VYVYLGGPSGVDAMPTTVLDGPLANGYFGVALAGADFDGDGFSDLVVGAYSGTVSVGRAYVFRGSASGLGAAPTVVLTGTETRGSFGIHVTVVGDINGDGYPDVAVSETPTTMGGIVHVFTG